VASGNGGSGAGGAGGCAGGVGDAGSAGGTSAVGVCSAFDLSPSFELASSAPGQNYVRCQTLGPEAGWQEIAIAADGQHVAARTGAGTVRLIATNPWHEVAQIASPLGVLDAMAFAPDGQLLAVLSAEMGEVSVWRSGDGTRVASFAAPPGSTIDAILSSLAYSSDGTQLATSLGALINVSTGAMTSWKTGAPLNTSLVVNPESQDLGEAVPELAFTAGDSTLFVDTLYQIGNSPQSTRLELRMPASGHQTVLFDMYSRALSGYALSFDRRKLALAITEEGAVAGFRPGLAIDDAVTGAVLVADPRFTGTVLGFSRDGSQLFTLSDTVVSALSTGDLHTVAQFAWPAGTVFLGVSPDGDVVGTNLTEPTGGSTTWFDPATGVTVRTAGYWLRQIVWTPDGQLGAGTGDTAALFHVWHDPDGAALCAPGLRGPAAPTLAALGTFDDPAQTPSATSDDGSIVVADAFVIHTHATDWTALHVNAASDGSLLRTFGATGGNARMLAISQPSGARLFTGQGPDVAVWCR
jgi:WD40 repeat protein